MKTRRSAVFVIPNDIVGHQLVFKHYTNKVVVGNFTEAKPKIHDIQNAAKQNLSVVNKLR